MLSTIEAINSAVNNFIWGVPAMICIIGVGLVLSFRTRFLQIRKFPYAMKVTFGRMFKKREASDGAMTPFQAVCTALAATVGTGNIAGVAGAIAIGGPGAVFWMWISAILGMCTKFSEVTLAVHFREKNVHGDLVGGPMYYIKNGLKKHWHWLAYLFSAFGVLTVFGTGNATQVNTITTAINTALMNYHVISKDAVPTVNLVVGIILAVLIFSCFCSTFPFFSILVVKTFQHPQSIRFHLIKKQLHAASHISGRGYCILGECSKKYGNQCAIA